MEPPPRADHTAVFLESAATADAEAAGALLVFGGRSHYAVSQTTAPLSDLFAYNFNTSKWTNLTLSASATPTTADSSGVGGVSLPEARLAHAADAIPTTTAGSAGPAAGEDAPSRTQMLVFGGVVYDKSATVSQILDATLWQCSFDFAPATIGCTWTEITKQPAEEGRDVGGAGGAGSNRRRSSNRRGSNSNSIVASTSDWPAARAWHTGSSLRRASDGATLLAVFGGKVVISPTVKTTNQLWLYNHAAKTWTLPEQAGSVPPPRFGHAAKTLAGGRLVLVGGFDTDNVMKDGWIYDVNINEWREILTLTTGVDDYPLFRGYHSLTYHAESKSLVVFGGTTLDKSDRPVVPGNVAVLQPGCNKGKYSQDFADTACEECPVGQFASEPGAMQCADCPAGLQTADTGCTAAQNCSVCAEGWCNGHEIECTSHDANDGSGNMVPKCSCQHFYAGTNCEKFAKGWLAGFGVSGAVFVLLLVLKVRQHYTSKHKELLADWQMISDENAELRSNWEIFPDDLQFKEEVAHGMYGEVWIAKYQHLTVAVKKLKSSWVAGSMQTIYRTMLTDDFEKEAEALQRLKHENIVYFYGAGYDTSGEDGGRIPFLVTEYAERGALSAVLGDLSIEMDFDMSVQFALDAAEGMKYLHNLKKPIVHRDLKSQNLLVTEDFGVKVADFGTSAIEKLHEKRGKDGAAAAAAAAASGEREHGQSSDVGTLEWMAPELHNQEEYGAKVDVYSFGIVMWEIITREQPWRDTDPGPGGAYLREKVCAGERPPVPAYVSAAYSLLMQKCWNTSPARRPTFAVVVQELKRIQAGAQPHHWGVSPTHRPSFSSAANAAAGTSINGSFGPGNPIVRKNSYEDDTTGDAANGANGNGDQAEQQLLGMIGTETSA